MQSYKEIASVVQFLLDQQAARIEQLEHRVHELERQLGSNSSKPPSSDGLRKTDEFAHDAVSGRASR